MDCKFSRQMIPLLVNNRLSKSEYYRVLIHLAQCQSCKNELIFEENFKKQVEQGFKRIGATPEIEIPVQASSRYWKNEVDELIEGLITQMLVFSKLK